MGVYLAVGVVCFFAGAMVGCFLMCLMVASKNNDELDLDKERENGEDWEHGNSKRG